MSLVHIIAIAGIVLIALLAVGTVLGFIDWRDPRGLK